MNYIQFYPVIQFQKQTPESVWFQFWPKTSIYKKINCTKMCVDFAICLKNKTKAEINEFFCVIVFYWIPHVNHKCDWMAKHFNKILCVCVCVFGSNNILCEVQVYFFMQPELYQDTSFNDFVSCSENPKNWWNLCISLMISSCHAYFRNSVVFLKDLIPWNIHLRPLQRFPCKYQLMFKSFF